MTSLGMNPELEVERSKASFDVRSLSAYLYGGPDKVARREFLADRVEEVPELKDPRPVEFMGRAERYTNATRKILAAASVITEHSDVSNLEEVAYVEGLVMAGETQPFNLHYSMFLPTLQNQASDEQQEEWLPKAMSRAIIGTYAQTEMGHGTNLARLETTATYDPKAEEFILHSPTLTATKWWPGNLGKTSNYAVVMAKLISRGTNHGPHAFLVQLRDEDTHIPLPGITVGDIGPKFGMESNDNGFLRLDHVRIPRKQMMMRNAKIMPDGTYVPPPHAKLGFGSMVFVRTMICRMSAVVLAKASTIGIRYSAIRRQGEVGSVGGEEWKLLDYPTQRYRLLPGLAGAFAYFVAAGHVRDAYNEGMKKIHQGDTSGLAQLHALTSGLKAHISWDMARGIEQARLACGGHGYLKASGLPELYALYVGACTYEGDNIVLLLQVARFLMKELSGAAKGRALASTNAYLGAAEGGWFSAPKSSLDASLSLGHLQELFEHISRRQNKAALAELEKRMAKGATLEAARTAMGVSLCKAARSHIVAFVAKSLVEWVARAPVEIKPVLTALARLYLTNAAVDKAAYGLEDGFLSPAQLELCRRGVEAALEALRGDAVALVDAWGFRDRELRSVLGRWDGRVYENLLQWAANSELNQTDVLDAHHKYLGPMMKEARSKL